MAAGWQRGSNQSSKVEQPGVLRWGSTIWATVLTAIGFQVTSPLISPTFYFWAETISSLQSKNLYTKQQSLGGKGYQPQFTDEETEAQRGCNSSEAA